MNKFMQYMEMATVIVSGKYQINHFYTGIFQKNKLRMYSVSLTFRNIICRGELSPDVLITFSAQAEAILLYMKIGYVLNLKNLPF